MTPPDTSLDDLDIAVCHGNYLARGGGERVAEAIARTFDAPLYYGFGSDAHVPDDIDATSVCNDSVLSRFDGSKLVRDSYYFWHFQDLPELTEYDVVIQSGNEFGWYTPPDWQTVIRYTHSTPRTPYDRFHDQAGSAKEKAYSVAAKIIYQHTIAYPDLFLVNSDLIERRMDRYFDKTDGVHVCYPPVDVESYPVGSSGEREDDLFVTWSRLYPSKNIDEIVKAFADHPDKRLVVGGTGPERDRLEALATDNVSFTGWLEEDEKRDLLRRAQATIFAARNEDFGLVPAEAFAAGCPVIGVRDGFTQHQIADGVSGLVYDRGVDALSQALARFDQEGVAATPEDIAAHAEQYSVERFQRELRRAVEATHGRAAVAVDQNVPTTEVTAEVRADGGGD